MTRTLHLLLPLLVMASVVLAQPQETAPDSTESRVNMRFMYLPVRPEEEVDTGRYVLEAGPDIWYNSYDGLKFGVRLHGGRADRLHVFDATLWGNSGLGQYGLPEGTDRFGFMPLSFIGDYRTSLHAYWANTTAHLSAKAVDGLYGGVIRLTKGNRSGNILYGLGFKVMYRPENNGTAYLLDRAHWYLGEWNNSINASMDYSYTYGAGQGSVGLDLRTSNLGSDHDYHYLRIEAINTTEFWMLSLRSRAFLQLGYGTDWASESLLYIDRASPEELSDNRFTRSAGIFPADWAAYGVVPNHFHHGGGLNLRGYAGYLSPEVMGDEVITAYSGAHGAAINLELEFDRVLGSDRWPLRKWLHLSTYLFGDAGIISISAPDETPRFAMPRADAGLGLALTVKNWGGVSRLRPFTVRFDMPFLVSRPPALQPEPWRFRWVLGIGRTF